MAAEPSSRLSEIFSGHRRASALPTLAIAIVVTALVAVPLLIRAANEDSAERLGPIADGERLTVTSSGSEPAPLTGTTLVGDALIVFDDPDAEAASFNLFVVGETTPVLASQDLQGPTFSPVLDGEGSDQPLDSTLLANGAYELFVVVMRGDVEQRTVATFEVANP